MKQDKEEGNRIEGEEARRLQAGRETAHRPRALGQGAELPQMTTAKKATKTLVSSRRTKAVYDRFWQPPPDRHAATVPPG